MRTPSSSGLLLQAALLVLFTGCAHTPAPTARYSGPLIDIHTHVSWSAQSRLGESQPEGTEALLALAAKAGVEKTGIIVMAPRGQLDVTRQLNDQVLEAARQSQGRLFPVGSVHPEDGDLALAELERLKGLGFRMIKLHPNSQQFDVASPALEAVVKKASELDLVILFDGYSPFDANQPGKFLLLAARNPKARIVLAHLGGPRFHDMALFAMMQGYSWYQRNVWFDLSAVARFYAGSPYADELVWLVRKLGVDRVLFGSDWPVDTPEQAAAAVHQLGFTAEEEAQLFHGTAASLLGFSPEAQQAGSLAR
ncbi:amidohydrolase family protein [Pyxidicoccus sp. MSG2]|uniref:amidohydrolase family protein n=1 Tax=Pyxidicoccus sp. MSG2 TaxID=2996790 RepID=UPI00227147F0|nr:amidohydrolase family protein [Pyxidicoccus sp. MSG2]MCY1018139.1 amidohydrolase family protein [Pyxidicoccus sp. MSG2]